MNPTSAGRGDAARRAVRWTRSLVAAATVAATTVGLGLGLPPEAAAALDFPFPQPGNMLSWGWNVTGQLGYDTGGGNDSFPQPHAIHDGDTGVAAVSAGFLHSVALHSDGSVKAWGSNSFGQVGDNGAALSQLLPVDVRGLERGSGVVAVSAGSVHNLALKADGSVIAWGYNGRSQLGIGGPSADRAAPAVVAGLGTGSGVVAVAAGGDHFLALKADGSVVAWGDGQYGKLGLGVAVDVQTAPAEVAGLGPGGGVVAVAAGGQHSLALKADGTVLAWGHTVDDPEGLGVLTPATVAGLGPGSGVVALAAGGDHTLALRGDGAVLAWGENGAGQLGDGGDVDRWSPGGVTGLGAGSGVVALAAGAGHNLALRADGSVLAWGLNNKGQLGNGGATPFTPTPIDYLPAGSQVVALAGGLQHSLAVKAGLARAARFTPLAPARLWDSRLGPGPVGRVGPGGSRQIKVTGVGGVPAVGVTGVVLNVTVVGPSASTYVTAWATGENRPWASNLNSPAGDVRANLVTVKVGVGGQVSFFNGLGTTDVVVDVAGWYGPGGAQRYTALSPSRAWDTRFGPGPIGRLGPGGTQSLKVTGVAGVPATNVSAVVLNLTAVTPSSRTFLTAWPSGGARPLASNLNVPAGDTRANLVTVKVGADGRIIFVNDTGSTDVVVDIAGYYSASGDTLTLSPPVRRWDSRTGTGPGGRLGPREVRSLAIGAPGSAVVVNVTAVGASAGTFVTAWPEGELRPLVSNLNLPPGDTQPNLVVVKSGPRGHVSFANEAGEVDLIVDVAGWFEPGGP